MTFWPGVNYSQVPFCQPPLGNACSNQFCCPRRWTQFGMGGECNNPWFLLQEMRDFALKKMGKTHRFSSLRWCSQFGISGRPAEFNRKILALTAHRRAETASVNPWQTENVHRHGRCFHRVSHTSLVLRNSVKKQPFSYF